MAKQRDRQAGSTSNRARERSAESEWAQDLSEPAAPPTAEEVAPEDSRPAALVVDDGALDDVCRILEELGAEHSRVCADESATGLLERPSRLYVTTAQHALSPRFSPSANGDDVVSIAVARDPSQTMCAMMRRLGFDYVVRRPVHPEALRLLLLQALYRGSDKRRGERRAFGFEVAWKTGWRRAGTCPMTEISPRGCRLVIRERVDLDARIRIRIPAEAAGGSAFSLKGRIVRRHLEKGRADAAGVAVAFENLSRNAERRLAELLEKRSSGPAALPRAPGERPSRPRPPSLPEPRTFALSAPPRVEMEDDEVTPRPRAPAPPPPAAGIERRRDRRAALNREIVALDTDAHRAACTFMGTDLSLRGMRLEQHHTLRVGSRLRIALYDDTSPEPVVIDAEVARDDGPHGFALLFARLGPDARARLDAILAGLPEVECLGGVRESERVFLGEILLTDEVVPGTG